MDGLRTDAKLIVVGITPGQATARLAHQTMRAQLAAGHDVADAMDAVKAAATFSGFRALLVEWLDWLGVAEGLALTSTSELWDGPATHLVHPTSAIRYPVLVNGKNYNGSSPRLRNDAMLSGYLRTMLAPELERLPAALVVPLGRRVDEGLEVLCDAGLLDPARCLVGFPHPSGANGNKGKQWDENRQSLRRKTSDWFGSVPS